MGDLKLVREYHGLSADGAKRNWYVAIIRGSNPADNPSHHHRNHRPALGNQ